MQYRSTLERLAQGQTMESQTMESDILNIAKPPSGPLSGFNTSMCTFPSRVAVNSEDIQFDFYKTLRTIYSRYFLVKNYARKAALEELESLSYTGTSQRRRVRRLPTDNLGKTANERAKYYYLTHGLKASMLYHGWKSYE